MRVVFVTDLHGSTLAFQKALRAAEYFEADLLMIGGDLSGKRLVPIVPANDGYLVSEPHVLRAQDASDNSADRHSSALEDTISKIRSIGTSELDYWCKRLEAKGYYWHISSSEEIAALNANEAELQKLLSDKIFDRLMQWCAAANRIVGPLYCLWTGGNDDEEELIQQMNTAELGKFICGDSKIIKIEGFDFLSLGYSNVTPFKTSRELTEVDLFNRLQNMLGGARSPERLIMNVHVPPSDCGILDLVPNPKNPRDMIHVGSTGVRKFIEEVQPLADFVGHVHEGKGMATIGKTYVFNPGSDYQAGILHGYVVSITKAKVLDYAHFSQ